MTARRRLALVIACGLLATGALTCYREAPPTPATATTPAQRSTIATCADPVDLARRLGPPPAAALSGAAASAGAEHVLGETTSFWVTDLTTQSVYLITATLDCASDHALIYQQAGAGLGPSDCAVTTRLFERYVHPPIVAALGEDAVGPDGDPRLTIVNASIPGVGGYFSIADQFAPSVRSYSNLRKAIYINIDAVPPDTIGYVAVLAHEFTHAIRYSHDPCGQTWINEGIAELSADIIGLWDDVAPPMLEESNVQLTGWSEHDETIGAHYFAAYSFIRFLAENYSGSSGEGLRDLVGAPGDGTADIDAFLERRGYSDRFDDVFWAWARSRAATDIVLGSGESYSGELAPYAAVSFVVEAPPENAVVAFAGATETSLMPSGPTSGDQFWWSGRGDSLDAHLTRELDLRGVGTASLRFRLWHDIERYWDYAYVTASTDGGQTWRLLSGRHTTNENPLRNGYGVGYSGGSGDGASAPTWVEESVDLTPFAGQRVLLRFEYVTDEAYAKSGVFIDDIAVPEIGFADDAEADAGWTAVGFARVGNRLTPRYRVAAQRGDATTELTVDASGKTRGDIGGPGPLRIVVASLTPTTTLASPFTLTVAAPTGTAR